MTETKHDRFKRIAVRRANDLLEGIRILGNCSNTTTYDYTPQEVDKIFKELEKALHICQARFTAQSQQSIRL
jgi:hypothetical protein